MSLAIIERLVQWAEAQPLVRAMAYAVAIEEALAHPAEPLPFAGRLALGLVS